MSRDDVEFVACLALIPLAFIAWALFCLWAIVPALT